MPYDPIGVAFRSLHKQFRKGRAKALLQDFEAQIEEEAWLTEILVKAAQGKENSKYVSVTFDRRKRDKRFVYASFDLLLSLFDRISGGRGIYKPANQMRALKWGATRKELRLALEFLGGQNRQINFRRLLITPFPLPPVGTRLDPAVMAIAI